MRASKYFLKHYPTFAKDLQEIVSCVQEGVTHLSIELYEQQKNPCEKYIA